VPSQRNNEEVDFDEVPPIVAPLLSLLLLWSAWSVGFGGLKLNLLIGGVGVLISAAFFGKLYLLQQREGFGTALNYALTPPADRNEDYSVDASDIGVPSKSNGIEEASGVSVSDFQNLDPYQFEEEVAEVWGGMGFDAEVTKGSSDRGIDVKATRSDPYEKRILIQAKRYKDSNKVGAETVRKCAGMNRDDVDEVIIVTTSNFTSQARSEAREKNVKLIDGQKFLELYHENVAE
jgi:hypothetical protein